MTVSSPSQPRARTDLLARLFPGGIPRLWCPPLTHYDRTGAIDPVRMSAHLRQMSAHVRGFLIPGSTGDGWELNDREFWELFEIAWQSAAQLNFHWLIGALKADAGEALKSIQTIVSRIKNRTGQNDPQEALLAARVCGFAVCAPRGKSVSQAAMERALVPILELGLPVALYQLPQVTENEVGPELVSELAERFPNFVLFKDSSGNDRVVNSGKDLAGVVTLRGAEGDYARWLSNGSSGYGGFLLSTANCFASQLDEVIQSLLAGCTDASLEISSRVTAVIGDVFELVRPLRQGNIYANANKAIDHFAAYGPQAAARPGPRLHGGDVLSRELLERTGQALLRHKLMPQTGYVAE